MYLEMAKEKEEKERRQNPKAFEPPKVLIHNIIL